MLIRRRVGFSLSVFLAAAFIPAALSQSPSDPSLGLQQDVVNFGNAMEQGNLRVAERNAADAVERLRQHKGSSKALSIALTNLAAVYLEEGRYGIAESTCAEALDLAWKKFGPKSSETAWAMCQMGQISIGQKQYSDSEKYLNRARSIVEGAKKLDSRLYTQIIDGLAMTYSKEGAGNKAVELVTKAIDMSERVDGKDNADEADLLSNLATFYVDQGDYTKAEPVMRHAMDIIRTSGLTGRASTLVTMNNLAVICHHQGRIKEAEDIYRAVIAGFDAKPGADQMNLARSLSNLSDLLVDAKRPAEAEPLIRRALDICEKQTKAPVEDMAHSYNALGLIYAGERRLNEARQAFLRGESLLTSAHSQDTQGLAVIRANIATVERALGGR